MGRNHCFFKTRSWPSLLSCQVFFEFAWLSGNLGKNLCHARNLVPPWTDETLGKQWDAGCLITYVMLHPLKLRATEKPWIRFRRRSFFACSKCWAEAASAVGVLKANMGLVRESSQKRFISGSMIATCLESLIQVGEFHLDPLAQERLLFLGNFFWSPHSSHGEVKVGQLATLNLDDIWMIILSFIFQGVECGAPSMSWPPPQDEIYSGWRFDTAGARFQG